MPHQAEASLLSLLHLVRPWLTAPGFWHFLVLAVGWIRSHGRRSVTGALVETGVAGRRHHEAFHRFFSRGTWNPDTIGRAIFHRLVAHLEVDSPVRIVIDDTLARKTGPKVFGIASHLDAVQSTRKRRVFSFGHCWVVLAVVVQVPFSRRLWALPVLFRLYRRQADCDKNGGVFRKKTELARDMLDMVAWWTARRVELATDCAYCNETVLRNLPDHVVVFGAMRLDAALTALPKPQTTPQRGRPRIRGEELPPPEKLAGDTTNPWKTCNVYVYRRELTMRYKSVDAQWYQVTGGRLLRIVLVPTETGTVRYRAFFCTDPTRAPAEIIAGYGGRWSVECIFRDVKQFLGFADSQARTQSAVERVAPFVGYVYSLLVIWCMEGGSSICHVAVPNRPWYPNKQCLSFEDILRGACRVTAAWRIDDLAAKISNLPKIESRVGPRSKDRFKTAA